MTNKTTNKVMKASFNHTKHIVRYVPNHYPANRTISYWCMSSLLLMFLARRRLVCLSPILSTTRSFSLKWYCGKISDVCVPRLSLPATSNATKANTTSGDGVPHQTSSCLDTAFFILYPTNHPKLPIAFSISFIRH